MHDHLFEHQRALEDAHLAQYAREVGLDESRFARELSEHTHAERVRKDFMSGIRSGVNGTPTFFINGVRHDDGYEAETLLSALKHAASQPDR